VWRMTGHPAEVYGLTGRGRIAPGWVSDLVAFDPDTVGCGEIERVVDFPAGADRLVTRSVGIHYVWVNGIRIWSEGAPVLDARPGLLLRQGVNPPPATAAHETTA